MVGFVGSRTFIRRCVACFLVCLTVLISSYPRNVPREFRRINISAEDTYLEIGQALYEDDTFESRIAQDILFLVSESVLYACADAVWSLDE